MIVIALWRYPVKAMLGERLEAVDVGSAGPAGDRGWLVVDAAAGERIANRRGASDPRLRACRAELLPGSRGEGDGHRPPLRVTLPGGEALTGDRIEAGLSELLGRKVRLDRAAERDGRFGAPGAHQDLAPVHLIAAGTLDHLRALAPDSDWDARRFRPNILVDDGAGGAGFVEDSLIGRGLRAPSGLELAVGLPVPRCVVPTRASEELPADPSILRTVNRRHAVDLGPLGRSGCLGAYAEVPRAGTLAVGDALEVTDGGSGERGPSVGETVARALEARGSG